MVQITKGEFSPMILVGLRPEIHSFAWGLGK